jgi:GTP-binding protein
MQIRNVAVIAHVDHGKTTLVDQMLRQAGIFRANEELVERVMDSNPLERERGITILSKNTAVHWGDVKINIVDTPGHADFGGEVERVLRMVEGVLILVDSAEGPMPQTRFVLRKALLLGLLPIVVINKVDRPDARLAEVHDEVLELLMELDADNAQLDASFVYASGREGWATTDLKEALDWSMASSERISSIGAWEGVRNLTPLFQTILGKLNPPSGDPTGPFQMLVSTLDFSPYIGRIAIGRVERGKVRVGDRVAVLPLGSPGPVDEAEVGMSRVMKLYEFTGLQRLDLEEARAGDIVALAGVEGVEIGTTLTDPESRERLRGIAVEEPTLSVDFSVNDSPFSGRSGKFVTSRQLRDRLFRELERNLALRVEETDSPDTFTVSGRGELHLTILMETMRREGYEFQVSRPRVIAKKAEDGSRLEPYEEVVIEVPEGMVGVVMEKMGGRGGSVEEMLPTDRGITRLKFRIATRGLFGYRSEFLTDTRGEGVLHHRFLEYGPWVGTITGRKRGVLVSDREGVAVGFALFHLQERATMFVTPGVPVYGGMITGEHVRPGDMDVNVCKEKKASNIRTTATDENIRLEPARKLTLELAMEFIEEDELIEVTPDALRLRKREVDVNKRRKAARAGAV